MLEQSKLVLSILCLLLCYGVYSNLAPSQFLDKTQNSRENKNDSLIKKTAHTSKNSRCAEIACFTSIHPTFQQDTFIIPQSHRFQVLAQSGQAYQNDGAFPPNFDFTCFVPQNGSSTNGIITLNHENYVSGGMSIMDAQYDSLVKLWSIENAGPVDFSGVVRTERNCSGGLTPWGTVLLGEEIRTLSDTNNDGYKDVGWLVEVNPITRQVVEYGNAIPEKLWAMGRMKHENASVSYIDNRTVYYGEDDSLGCVYKYIANEAGNLSNGLLYVLALDAALINGEPTSYNGTWRLIQNSTPTERNNTHQLALDAGGTPFYGIEDVEIGPDGYIYFASKGHGRVFRFQDNGTTISLFETYVGGRNYFIQTEDSLLSEPWGIGNDNLAFDGEENLWVLQDGSKNYIWVVRNGHSQLEPQVELFGSTPRGSEPTGITFSPDFRFLFMSLQHPDSTNIVQLDASGSYVKINVSSMIVIARKENLGTYFPLSTEHLENQKYFIKPAPIPFSENLIIDYKSIVNETCELKLLNINGKVLYTQQLFFSPTEKRLYIPKEELNGIFWLQITGPSINYNRKIIAE